MSVYVLDTDTITLIQFGHATAVRKLAAQADPDIILSVVSFQEQMRGWLGRLNRLTTVVQQTDWFDRLVHRMFPVWRRYGMLSVSVAALQRFDQMRSLRLNIGPADLRLAALALEHNLTVVTRNTRDFSRVPGLRITDWTV